MKNCRVDYKTYNNVLFSFLVDFTNNDEIIYSKVGNHKLKGLYSELKYCIDYNMRIDFYNPKN